MERCQQAIGEYLKIVKLDPNDVLILNTIGDLYLRQKNISEANKYFSRVAENYVRNNFFLKAIAVYKKILSADPNNLEINATMASLYAKQGLSIDARNQYLKVAALLEKEGRSREIARSIREDRRTGSGAMRRFSGNWPSFTMRQATTSRRTPIGPVRLGPR